ncbi:hypothetical protein [Streptomyces sp. NPDC088554]|uniref:hypothetical protein n=1 Tax=Streptomyces sp. NPDC088554 TaxID=3365865 RepID=UPI00381E162F
MYVLNGRWRLIVAPLASEEREVRVEDPNPVRQLVVRDLGPADSGLAPASFGHRLIENGFIIDPAEREKPNTVNGWSSTDAPSGWSTVCYPMPQIVS